MYIVDAYSDATVFVTGGTGFVGKGVVEKILRACPRVRKIVLLIRARKNLTGEQRLDKLKQDVVFDRVRALDPALLDKLTLVFGDIGCAPGMGLSAGDEQLLVDEVNFVIHSAATVSFNLPFGVTSNLNILGTRRLLELCLRMKKLKSVVYVSTAYSGLLHRVIEEKIHPTKEPMDMERFLNTLTTGTESDKMQEARRYQDDHPNTYTLSKFFAEHLVDHYHRKFGLPISVVRPSMIGSAYREPFPGWVTNFNGAIGDLAEVARGAVGSILCKEHFKMDLVPIDLVCNVIVAAGWWTIENPSKKLRIYNATIELHPCLANEGYGYAVNAGREYPSKYTMMYPDCWLTDNRLVYEYRKWFYQMIPAAIYDLILRARGEQPRALSIARMYNKQSVLGSFFRFHEFTFGIENVTALVKASKGACESGEFKMQPQNIDNSAYVRDMWLGIRRHLLKESEVVSQETLDKGQILQIIDVFYSALQCLVVTCFFWFLLRCFI